MKMNVNTIILKYASTINTKPVTNTYRSLFLSERKKDRTVHFALEK